MFEIFFTLFRGGTLVCCDRSALLNDLPGMINRLDVDAAELTPTVAGTLLGNRANIPGLKLLLTIGEMLTKSVVQEFGATTDQAGILYGMYGPTEAAIHCTIQPLFKADIRTGVIGVPLKTVSCLVLAPVDSNAGAAETKILPLGQIGELAVGGHQLADGYFNRDEQTRSAFVQSTEYGRIYRTGDKARILPDGTIECLGRIQGGQIKLRGQRVELGEIEQAVTRCNDIRFAVVMVIKGIVVAFCLTDNCQMSVAQVKATCKEWLPSFMVPNDAVFLTDLPRLPSGKADQKRLRIIYEERNHDDDAESHESQSTLEQRVCQVISELLQRTVHVGSSINKLGIDSLVAIRLASQLRKVHSAISAVDILRADTIKALCGAVEEAGSLTDAKTSVPLDYSELEQEIFDLELLHGKCDQILNVFPCTPLQVGMVAETLRDAQAYCNWIEVEFSDTVSSAEVVSAIRHVVASNEILRTGFAFPEGAGSRPTQLIWKDLIPNQIRHVKQFDYTYSLPDHGAFLHPLRIDVATLQGECRVVFYIHHALYDGWSMDLILADLSDLLSGGEVVQRPPFSTVAEYLESPSGSTAREMARDYFRDQLRDYQPQVFPSLSGLNIAQQALNTARSKISLTSTAIRRRFGESIHPQALFQGALSCLMATYLGIPDIVFGSVTSGRTIPVTEIESIIGPCIAVLPLRIDVKSCKTSRELLNAVSQSNRQLLEHCTLPLQEIRRLVDVNPGKPLFDVLFVWQESLDSHRTANPKARIVDSADFLEFALTLEVEPQEDGIALSLRYQPASIPSLHANLLLSQLEAIVNCFMLERPPYLDEVNQNLPSNLLSISNPQPDTLASTQSLSSSFELHANSSPDKDALAILEYDNDTLVYHEVWSYRRLNQEANKLAHALRAQNVKPDDLIAVFMPKSRYLYLSILAVIKSGAGYLPITPETPEERVRYILNEAGITVCLVHNTSPKFVLSVENMHTVVVDENEYAAYPDTNLRLPLIAPHAAYCVFTSGTTGKPKGVVVTQGNLISNIQVLGEIYPVGPDSRLLQACSQAFDVSVFEIFFAWYSGMCVCAGTNDVLFRDLESAVRFSDVTHLSLTPTVAALVDPSHVPKVEFLVTAGEGVTDLVFRQWAGRGLYNGYGPSETTNICSVNAGTQSKHARNNVGPPFRNTSAFVVELDSKDFQLVPKGAFGELCFGGEQVFRGYLNMPELTASRIFNHPEYGRVYRSGDLGRILSDETVLVLGRVDDQVKIRGQRIELGEINSVLIRSEAVQDCAVMVSEGQHNRSRHMVGFVVPEGHSASGPALLEPEQSLRALLTQLFEEAATSLPTYMIPSAIVPLSNIPMTPQGKIDKRRMLALYHGLDHEHLGFVSRGEDVDDESQDWTDMERDIRAAVAEVVGVEVDSLRRGSSFFSLGLDSVSAIPLAQRLRSKLARQIEVSKILRFPSVASLASELSRMTRSIETTNIEPENAFDDATKSQITTICSEQNLKIQHIWPCTPLQEAMLSAETSAVDSAHAYSNHSTFEIQTEAIPKLRQCFVSMCARHEILRTCFISTSDRKYGFAQVVLESFEPEFVASSGKIDIDEQLAASSLAVDNFRPPFRLVVVSTSLSAQLHILMHHALYDGEAIARLLFEVEQIFNERALPPPVSFRPYLERMVNMSPAGPDAYWERQLDGYTFLPLPRLSVDRHDAVSKTYATARDLTISLGRIEEFCKHSSVTLLSTCQAAWAKVLSLWIGENDFCFGNVISGRTLAVESLERLVAPCFNTLPVRLRLHHDTTNIGVVQRLQRLNAEALNYQFSALRRIQARWNKTGDKLFETLFILQRSQRPLDTRVWSLKEDSGYMGFPLVCEVTPHQETGDLSLTLHHDSSILSLEQARDVTDTFEEALLDLIDNAAAGFWNLKAPKIAEAVQKAVENHQAASLRPYNTEQLINNIHAAFDQISHVAILSSDILQPNIDKVLLFIETQERSQGTGRQLDVKDVLSIISSAYPKENTAKWEIIIANGPLQRHDGRLSLLDLKRTYAKQASPLPSTHDEQPRGELSENESAIRDAFAKFSDVPLESVGVNRTIFQLGLDSINAIQVAKHLRLKGYKVAAQDVLENPTVASLAARIGDQNMSENKQQPGYDFAKFQQKHKDSICKQLSISPTDVQKIRPCTSLQSGMVAQFLHTGGKVYFNHISFQADADVDMNKLLEAWKATMNRHSILRTGFVTLDDGEHAFAMITYSPQTMRLPCTSMDCTDEPINALLGARPNIAMEVRDSLHMPVWRLSVLETESAAYLQLSIHHALYDAESLKSILTDAQKFYSGAIPVSQPIPTDPFLATVLEIAQDVDKTHGRFWTETLKGSTPNKFPNLTPFHVSSREVCSRTLYTSISKEILEEQCRQLGITTQVAFMTAWSQVLSAYTGESDTIFGVVLSGRDVDSIGEVVFPTAVTIPFRCDTAADNMSLLSNVMALNTSIRKHQHSPLTHIQRWSGYPKEALFDTIFVYQRPEEPKRIGLWQITNEESTVEYPVSFEISATQDGKFTFRLVFWNDILPVEHAELFLQQVDQRLIEIMPLSNTCSTNPELGRLQSILPPKIPVISSEIVTLHGFLEASAQRYAGRIALEFASTLEPGEARLRWTYKELDEASNRIGHAIIDQGVRAKSLVGICFDKCPEASLAILGILKAGCAFVAIDHTAPEARKKFVLEDSQAVMVLTLRSSEHAFGGHVPLLFVDELQFDRLPTTRPMTADKVKPTDPSYCLYTSGSTGTPKGCILTHENAVQFILAFQNIFRGHWNAESRFLQFASFHFDVSVMEQFFSWSVGICVVSAPRDVIFEDLVGSLQTLEITHIDLTPSLARLVTPEDVPSLCKGVFITGGEQLKQEILNVWGSKSVIYNGYGPTECTIGCTMYPRVAENGKPSNIGWLYDNAGCYIFTPGTNKPVLRGAPGELCISGKLVGRGYLNRPELNKERFPFLEEFGERIYRTGDLVRMLHNDTFDFLGRIDDQVKLRGQRLELGEINSAIRDSSTKVADVTTLVMKHPAKQTEQLVAFVAMEDDAQKDIATILPTQDRESIAPLQKACQDRLAAYMVPSQFVLVQAIPLTPNNKVDAKALKSLFQDFVNEHDHEKSHGSPANTQMSSQENRVAQILAQLLAIRADSVSAASNIFQLGLDSISVFGFARMLRRAGFPAAQPNVIMRSRSITDLAQLLSKGMPGNDGAVVMAKQAISACQHRYRSTVAKALQIETSDIETITPCTPLQQGMIARSLESDVGLYYNEFVFELMPDVDLTRLKTSWQTVFERTPILRAGFIPVQDGYVQGVVRSVHLPWSERSYSKAEDRQKIAEDWRHDWCSKNGEIIKQPFEIVVSQHSQKFHMILHIFHGLYDASSLPLLLDAVRAEYEHHSSPVGATFYDVLPYGPLMCHTGARSFWTAQLREKHFTALPARPEVGTQPDSQATIDVHIKNFEQVRKRLNVTPQALVQVCWTAALQTYLRHPTTVGLLVSGRSLDNADAERVIGPMFNTVPFYLGLENEDTWASAARQCHEFNVALLPYQHTPLRDIIKWCQKSSGEPLFDSLLVFQKRQTESSSDTKTSTLWKPLETQVHADYPMSFEAEQISDDKLRVTIVALGRIASSKTCMQLLKSFESMLQSLLDNPEVQIPECAVTGRTNGVCKVNGNSTTKKQQQQQQINGLEDTWSTASASLRDIICQIAGVSANTVRPSSSIFELGLDSVDAIKISSRLKAKGIKLPVSTIMRHPRIVDMGKNISDAAPQDPSASTNQFNSLKLRLKQYFGSTEANSDQLEAVLPATPLQEAMLADMFRSDFCNYFNHDILRLTPRTDIERLKHACATVIEASPILRTAFAEVGDPEIGCSYAQLVQKTSTHKWCTIEMKHDDSIDGLLEKIRKDVSQHPTEVPLRLHFVQQDKERFLVVSMAHALYDGWSLGLVHEDISKAYDQSSVVRPDPQGVLQTILSGSESEADSFWHGIMHDASACIFPTRSDKDGDVSRVMHRTELRSRVGINALRIFTKEHNITVQALGQTCWALVLASKVCALDVTFGTVLSGRDSSDAQKALFPTMNTVAVRSFIHSTRAEMLRYTQSNLADILQYQHHPLRKIQQQAGLQGGRLFNTLFIYQRQPDYESVTEPLYESVGGASTTEYPINTEMELVEDALVWRTACEDVVVTADGAGRLLHQLDEVLQRIMQDPEADVLELEGEQVSVCGLPAFKLDPQQHDDSASDRQEAHDENNSSSDWSPTEAIVRAAMSTVAKVPESLVRKDSTLFQLGLDSISGIKVASLLRKQSFKITVSEILRAATVEDVAAMLGETQTRGVDEPRRPAAEILHEALQAVDVDAVLSRCKMSVEDVETIYPASAGQVLFLSLWQNNSGVLFYPTFEYEIAQHIDLSVVCDAWASVVARNPILRTTFIATADAKLPFLQAVLANPAKSFVTTELAAHSSWRIGSPSAPVQLHAQHMRKTTHLKLQIHHALYDAVSLPLLVSQLEELLTSPTTTTSAAIPTTTPTCTFADYLAYTHNPATLPARCAFWTTYLTDLPPLSSTPTPPPPTAYLPRTTIFTPAAIPQISTSSNTLHRANISIQALFIAAAAAAYAAERGRDAAADVLVGVYLANRALPLDGLARLAAPTVNVVPLRVRTPLAGAPLVDVAAGVQRDLAEVGSGERAGVGWWEVEELGRGVECVVNFLRLPEEEDEGDEGEGDEGGGGVGGRVRIREVVGVVHGRDMRAVGIASEMDVVDEGARNIVGGLYVVSSLFVSAPRSLCKGAGQSDEVERGKGRANVSSQPSVDLEAAVRDGALDIGIFAPRAMVDEQGVGRVLEDVKRRVREALGM